MQLLRVILLTLLSLGMQVPGGIAVELCLCQGLWSLFHNHGQNGREESCCGAGRDHCGGGETKNGDDTKRATKGADESCDGCIKLTTTKRPPTSNPARSIVIGLPSTSTWDLAHVSQVGREAVLPPLDRSHDPPGKRRNLPLLI